MLRILTLVALLLAAAAPAVHGSSPEPTIVQGPAGGGYVVVLVAPGEDNWIVAEGRFTIGSKTVFGAIKYEAYDDGSNTLSKGELVHFPSTARVQVASPLTGTHRQDLMSVPDVQREREWVEVWGVDPVGLVFFAAGNVTDIRVIIHNGVLLGSATGTEAVAMWTDDLPTGEYQVAASTLPATSASTYATSRVETSFSVTKPIYGRFLPDDDGSLGRVILEDPAKVHRDCPCWVQPSTSSAGTYTLSVEGVVRDTLLYWAVAPEILLYTGDPP